MLISWIAAAVSVVVFMHLAFAIAVVRKKNDYADIAWGPGFVIASVAALIAHVRADNAHVGARSVLALALVTIWAARLAYHIARRNLGSPEDARYAKWRKKWGKTWLWRSYLQVFMLQGALLLVIASPLVQIVSSDEQHIDGFAIVGSLVWLLGFIFESVADHQLKAFKRSKGSKGKLMTTGLWSWSRHPNYFGEVVQWWGLAQIALPAEYGWVTLISPITITYLILNVSGVPMLEKAMEGREGFSDYKARVPEFFPRFPRDTKGS